VKRRPLLLAPLTAALPGLPLPAAAQAPAAKVLRWGVRTAEAGFDPARIGDQTSFALVGAIFEAPLTYDYLARPARMVPNTAAAMPEVRDEFRHFIVTLRPGIFFADHPLFGGRPRELTAADYVFSIKRFYDPTVIGERLYIFENAQLLGLSELRKAAIAAKTPFPYDTEVPGLRVLDRYRFEIRLGRRSPRFLEVLAAATTAGAVARELHEAHGGDLSSHPVGTGPFRLASWRRSSLVVLERNPRFRGVRFEGTAPAGDEQAASVALHLAGKTLPLLDRVEMHVIIEDQPCWLAFEGGDLDALEVPGTMAPRVVPGGQLAPYLQRRGVRLQQQLSLGVNFSFFNFDNPVVGGYSPAQVALRRAIALACDNRALLRHGYEDQGVIAQTMIAPGNSGHDPQLVSELARADPARAKALLDLHGFADRNHDGFRERPDGSPLTIELAFPADQRSRLLAEVWQRRMTGIGLRFAFAFMPFPELIRRTLAGSLQMSMMNWSGSGDGGFFLGLAYGPNAGQSNDARFKLDTFDELFRRQEVLPDGPEREALMQQATRLMLAYMPYVPHLHPMLNEASHARVLGWLRHPVLELRLLHADVETPA
jgi:ABC-type transport system substrate-binding protein